MKSSKKKEKSIIGKIILLIIVIAVLGSGVCLLFYRDELESEYIIGRLSDNMVTGYSDGIPDYNGSNYIILFDNKPSFTDKDIELIQDKYFSKQDYLERCGMAVARLHRSTMPTEERGEIGNIKPSGWKQEKYPGIVNSEPAYLYNRCHLIAYSLCGENDNPRNLITGTRYFNAEAMYYFEKQVIKYVENTDNHVIYRVTPYFKGNELVARGAEMEAYSVEDSGEGLSFHVFVYNQQPGIDIDYRTGDSKISEKETEDKNMDGYISISIDEAKDIFETKGDYIILDVRRADEFASGHIPGAINYANEDINDNEPEVLPDKKQTIYVYCRSGNRSKQASKKLAAMGYEHIIEFGGILDWTGEIEK